MTNAELADLRGALFGVKILLVSCLTQVAGTAPDPLAWSAKHGDEAAGQPGHPKGYKTAGTRW